MRHGMAKRREEECEGVIMEGKRNEELIEKERKMKVEAWKKEGKRIMEAKGTNNERNGKYERRVKKKE